MNSNHYDINDLQQAVITMQQGGIILYPTDTVWGIGCDATNPQAVQKIYQLKQRTDSKSMLVLLDAIGKLQGYVADIPNIAYDLIDCATKPLTIIYPNAKSLASNLIAEDGSIGIRLTTELFSMALCQKLRRPIVSTSANISGQPTPQNFQQISEQIKQGVDYIVQYRQDDLTQATPSAIIKLEGDSKFKIIRQ